MSELIINSKRNYGLDLLKILCMFSVILFHYSDHGGGSKIYLSINLPLTFNWIILAMVRIFGGICNCAFVLVSGYFLSIKKFNLQRLIKLYLQVWIYSVTIGIFCFIIRTETFTIKSVIKILMPFTFNEYWYFTTYIILFMLFPFINILLNSIDKKQHISLIVIMFVFFSLLPTFCNTYWLTGCNSILIFILLYITGAFIKKYNFNPIKNNKIYIIIAVLIMTLEVCSMIVLKICKVQNFVYFVWGMEKVPPIIAALLLFMYFKNLSINQNKLLSVLSNATFGIYLFHIGRLNVLLFQQIFNYQDVYNSPILLFDMLFASIIIYFVGTFIDWLRINFFEKPIMKFVNKNVYYDKLEKFISSVLNV